jgi:hypothetical protein
VNRLVPVLQPYVGGQRDASADAFVVVANSGEPGAGPVASGDQASEADRTDASQACQPARQDAAAWHIAVGSYATGASTEEDANRAAAAAYQASIDNGRALSERRLAAMFGKTSRRWARNRMAEAEQIHAAATAVNP